jgi:hypothetical protein
LDIIKNISSLIHLIPLLIDLRGAIPPCHGSQTLFCDRTLIKSIKKPAGKEKNLYIPKPYKEVSSTPSSSVPPPSLWVGQVRRHRNRQIQRAREQLRLGRCTCGLRRACRVTRWWWSARSLGSRSGRVRLGHWVGFGGLKKHEWVVGYLQCGGLWEVGDWDVEVVEKVDGNYETGVGDRRINLCLRAGTYVECPPRLTT